MGYYVEVKGEHVCRRCYFSCESCDGRHSQQCITCKPGFFKHGSSCVETCPERLDHTHLMRRSFINGVLLAKQTLNLLCSHFGNRTSKVCERCDPSCTKCVGHGNTKCLSCRHDYLYMKHSRQCLKSCPSGYYKDKWSTNCLRCDPTCKTCSGKDRLNSLLKSAFIHLKETFTGRINVLCCIPLLSDGSSLACLSCYDNFILKSSYCQNPCFIGFYPSSQVCVQWNVALDC